MAVIKAISSKANLKGIINYVTRENKTVPNLIAGKDCLAESSLEEMQYVKELYKKTDGRQYIHLIQSFSPEDKVTKEQIHTLGLKLAERFKGHQVLVATHIDREHTHNHLVINSVNFENGRKIQISKKDLQDIKDFSDELCIEQGLSVIEKTDKSSYMNTNQYKVAEKGESWKFKLINAIDNSMPKSYTKDEFIKNMNKLGYQVKWEDTRKYITYTTPEGMKCRDNRLYDIKYTKGEMENELRKPKTEQQNREGTTSNYTNSKNGIYVNRSIANERHIPDEREISTGYEKNKRVNGRLERGYFKQNGEIGKTNSRYNKTDNTMGISKFEKQLQYNRDRTEESREQNKNEIENNRVFSGFSSLLGILSSQGVNNRPKRQIRGYKRNLSKQTMKEYAIKMRNASGFNWEADEEKEM